MFRKSKLTAALLSLSLFGACAHTEKSEATAKVREKEATELEKRADELGVSVDRFVSEARKELKDKSKEGYTTAKVRLKENYTDLKAKVKDLSEDFDSEAQELTDKSKGELSKAMKFMSDKLNDWSDEMADKEIEESKK